MSKRSRPLTPAQVKDAADRAEGLKPPEPERKGGRPALYHKSYAIQAAKLCALGATDKEMADFFEVALSTLSLWKVEYPAFSEALKDAKAVADNRVERSLYQKAVGYTFESEKIFQNDGEVIRAATVEHIPPDTTACIFWLKNRRPQLWRDVWRHEHEFKDELGKRLSDALKRVGEETTETIPDQRLQ